MKIRKLLWRLLIVLSIFFNIFTFVDRTAMPDYKLGSLRQDIEVSDYGDDSKVLFRLPKNITVMDVSPRGIATIGLFDSERFSIVVVAPGSADFIDYSTNAVKLDHGALYRVSQNN
jgi:hypothetical protein